VSSSDSRCVCRTAVSGGGGGDDTFASLPVSGDVGDLGSARSRSRSRSLPANEDSDDDEAMISERRRRRTLGVEATSSGDSRSEFLDSGLAP